MRKTFRLLARSTRRQSGVALTVTVATMSIVRLHGAPAEGRQQGRYRFTTVLDSQRDGLDATRCAAINIFGTIAVQVHDTALDIDKYVTKHGADDTPVVIADTQRVPDFPTLCDNGFPSFFSDPSINARGEVAFQANPSRLTTRLECGSAQHRQRRQGVFIGDGGPLTTVAHSINPPGGDFISEFLVADQTVNAFGKFAFVPELDNGDSGLFVGSKDGTFQARFLDSQGVFDTPSSRVSMNEIGQIAFEDSGIFVSNPNGTFTTIVENSSGLSAGSPSLNNVGRVAFEGSTFAGDVQVLGIFTGRGGPITTVADSTGPYESFQEPSLNDLGAVVFTAELDDFGPDGRPIQGVFTGPDPKRDKVLQAGDRYEGVRVTSVVTCSEALNNLGQIVMTVQSENPDTFEVRTFVVKATPRD